MGWYGDYNNSTEVMEETERGARQQNYQILDKKLCQSYGALLYKTPDNKIHIDYFIFKGTKYKPLSWVDGFSTSRKRIPMPWIKQVLPNEPNSQITLFEESLLLVKNSQTVKYQHYMNLFNSCGIFFEFMNYRETLA